MASGLLSKTGKGSWSAGFAAATLTVLACVAVTPLAAEDASLTPEQAERALQQRKRELAATEGQAQTLQSGVADLDTEREKLNARLVETAGLIQHSEAQLTAIEGRMSELESQENIVRGSLVQRQVQISQLLGALQRMGRNPPPVLVTRREDALKMVRSAMLLAAAFPELRGQALSLSGRLDELVRVVSQIRTEGVRLQSETDRLNEARARLTSLVEAKKSTIADRQQELSSVRAASAEISKSVSDLSELITKLDRAVTEKTALGAYETELKTRAQDNTSQQATGGKIVVADIAPDSVPATTQTETKVALSVPAKPKIRVVELAPSETSALAANPGRIKPAIAFASAHGKLPFPAQGRHVVSFGEKTQYGGQSKGIVIETRSGAQITSPTDGWIVFAGEFRSYGQLLIINAGDGYHILLAGLSQIDVQPGQFVLTAEPIGTMSGGPKGASSTAPSNSPVLYVEFRKDGHPIDPDPWWVESQKKVQ